MNVTLKSITADAEKTIVEIARVSSARENKSEDPEKLIRYLIKNLHWSPFEHGVMTVEIETSRAIGAQLLRHRSFSFQELSQRYMSVDKIEPVSIRMQADKNRQSSTEWVGDIYAMGEDSYNALNPDMAHSMRMEDWFLAANTHLQHSMYLYNWALELGIAKECARMLLPMSISTTIYMTGSIRSWLSFLNVRLDNHAQEEAQLIAISIANILKEHCPEVAKATNMFNDFKGMFM